MSLQIQETELSRGNTSKDTFLFIYTPKNLSIDSFCGCSLRAGIKIISGFLLFIAISSFYAVLKEDKLTEIIFSSILTFFYLTASIYLFLSTIYLDYKYSRIGYIIYTIIFLIDTGDFLFVEVVYMDLLCEIFLTYFLV